MTWYDAASLPILLVPGLGCTARLYTEQMPALWTFGPVTVADHRRADSMDAIARQILAEAPPRFALAGLSMGGYIALAIMRLAPERVAKLALLDTGSRSDTPEAGRDAARRRSRSVQAGELDEIKDTLWPILVHKDRQGDAALKRIVGRHDADGRCRRLRRVSRPAILTRPDSRPGCRRSDVRRWCWSATAISSHRQRLSEEMAGLIPNSRLVMMPDCGHLSTLERPEAVTQALVAVDERGDAVRPQSLAGARARRRAACRCGRSG